jgi:hypothetical protein
MGAFSGGSRDVGEDAGGIRRGHAGRWIAGGDSAAGELELVLGGDAPPQDLGVELL